MSIRDCLLEATQAIRDSTAITEEMRDEIMDAVQRVLDDARLTDETKLARSITLAKEYRKDIFRSTVSKQADEVMQRNLTEMVQNLPEEQRLTELRKFVEPFYAIKGGNETRQEGVSTLMRAEQRTAAGKLWQVWEAIYGRTGWKVTYKDTPMAKQMHREMLGIDTGNKQAKDLAGQVQNVFMEYKERLRQAGVYVEDRDNFFPQSHDIAKIQSDEAGWVQFMRENLDPTLHPDPDATIARVRATLSTRHLTKQDDAAISMARKLEWRSPEAEADYFYRFGEHDSIGEALFEHLDGVARKTVLAEKLGPSAERNLDTIRTEAMKGGEQRVDELQAAVKRGEHGAKAKLDRAKNDLKHGRRIEGIVESMTGEMHNPANQQLANWASASRNWAIVQMLGKVPLSIIGTDFWNSVYQTRFHTGGFGKALGSQLKGIAEVMGNQNVRAYAKEMGAFSHALAASTVQRYGTTFQSADSAKGFSRRAAVAMQRAAGVYALDNAMRSASMLSISRNMMSATKMGWKELPQQYQRVLRNNGIDEAKWGQFQRAAKAHEGTGAVDVEALPRELRDLTLGFLYRELDSAVIHPQHFDRSLMTFGARAGTFSGEAAATLTQFMSWPISFFRNAVMRELSMGGTGAVGFGAGMIAAGVMTTQLYELAENRPMFEMDSPELWKRSVARSGLLSPVGEIMMNALSERGADATGPVVDMALTNINEISGATRDFIDGRTDRGAGKLLRVAEDVGVPNLWWTQYSLTSRAMDAAMWELDPAYKADQERRYIREGRQ